MINIYVGNLPYSVKDEELREAFEPFGRVLQAEVIFDRRTRRSRGYGFVEMESETEGRDAIAAMNGKDFQGRELRVDESQPKEKKTRDNDARPAPSQPQAAAPASAETERGGVTGFFKKLFG